MRYRPPPTIGPFTSASVRRGPKLKDPTRPRVPVAAVITTVDAGFRVTTLDTNALTIGALSSTLGTHGAAVAYASAIEGLDPSAISDLTGLG